VQQPDRIIQPERERRLELARTSTLGSGEIARGRRGTRRGGDRPVGATSGSNRE
jgi:hypothetical protein